MKRFLIVVIALALPPAVYFPTFGAERNEQLRKAQNHLDEVDMRIEQARSAERKLPQFRAEMERLGQEIDKVNQFLPPTPAIEEIHQLTESIASDNDLRLTHFEAGAPKALSQVQEVTITAEVIGTAQGTAEFLRKIQSASKIIDVSDVTLTKDPAGWRTDFLMTTYALR